MSQLCNRIVFEPINVKDLTKNECKKAMESLMFLAEKRNSAIKGWICANGSMQRNYISKEEELSLTMSTK